jgi:hypothetical protein
VTSCPDRGACSTDGGFTGRGGRKEAAGIVHRGEVVWSQDDIARAGGVHVVEGMRRGYAGYADGGYAVEHALQWHSWAPRQSSMPAAANDRPAQNISQTNNFIFRENPAAPASQNQIAAQERQARLNVSRGRMTFYNAEMPGFDLAGQRGAPVSLVDIARGPSGMNSAVRGVHAGCGAATSARTSAPSTTSTTCCPSSRS